ncbi:MAG: hypothetical protein R6X32_02770, partial [Chloroflexota bacterium]
MWHLPHVDESWAEGTGEAYEETYGDPEAVDESWAEGPGEAHDVEEVPELVAAPRHSRSVLTDCHLENHLTGWVDADCGAMKVVLQTGPSARGTMSRLFPYAGTYATEIVDADVSYWGERGEVIIGGKGFESVEFVLRRNEPGAFGGSLPDRDGEVVARGLYTIAPTSQGKTGMLCLQEGGFDRNGCMAYFQELTSGVLDGIGL